MGENEPSVGSDYITLAAAAELAPGRPSANAVWRWARKGVRSRAGQRVHLQHIRAGRRIFTTAAWVEQFVRELAEADAEHFDRQTLPLRAPRDRPKPTRMTEHERALERLKARGLL